MFVVLVTHSGGHGDETNILLVTDDPVRAYRSAVMVERYGYDFHAPDTGVTVYQPRPETPYPKELYRFLADSPPSPLFPVVFSRRCTGTEWVEEWWDESFRSLIGMEQTRQEPNIPA